MQPTYIPWIGYFDLLDMSDIFVLYDDVQLAKRSWQVRNRLKSSNGEIWLTLPVKKTASRSDLLIMNAFLNNDEKWKKSHLKTIEMSYSKTPYFRQLFDLLEPIYNKAVRVSELNIEIIELVHKKMNFNTELIRSSSLDGVKGNKDVRLVDICKKLSVDEYLSPQGSADYINEDIIGGEFVKNGIELSYHAYNHPSYEQLHSDFIPYLGIFDLLFNHGFEESLRIIRSGRQQKINFNEL